MHEILLPPWPKRWLIELNQDLEMILNNVSFWDDDKKLADIEFYVLVLEDRRFFDHNGFDFRSILREILKMMTFKKFGGASTVDMQFVRTIIGRYEKTISRKIREIILARLLRYHARKVVILRGYLDVAYFGTGIQGVDQAAYAIFGCSSYMVRGENAAILASVLLSPRPRTPSREWNRRVGERAAYALKIGATLEEGFKKVGIR